jgi:hypothetical protein
MRRGVLGFALLPALAGGIVALAGLVAHSQQAYTPGPQNINLPADWESRFIRYATMDRADRKQVLQMFVNPEAFAAAAPGQPLPQGTTIIMTVTKARLAPDGTPLRDQQGRFIPEPRPSGIAVQEKQPGWGVGYGPDKRNGEWEYALFTPDGGRNNASVEPCFTCHLQTRAQQDFAFNFWDYVQARK